MVTKSPGTDPGSLLQIPADVPATRHADGSFRVGDSRVHLWLLLGLLGEGAGPEELVANFPTVTLDDVRAIDAFRKSHPQQVQDYCGAVERQAAALKQRIAREQRARRAG